MSDLYTSSMAGLYDQDNVLVVEVPADSEPTEMVAHVNSVVGQEVKRRVRKLPWTYRDPAHLKTRLLKIQRERGNVYIIYGLERK